MTQVTCLRIGYGKVAKIHQQVFDSLKIPTIGIIDNDIHKQEEALKAGQKVVYSYEEAAKLNPFFWDIAVDTQKHFLVLQKIIAQQHRAKILIEKPICYYSQIEQLQELLNNFKGLLTVNENYASSTIVEVLQDIIYNKYKIIPKKITVEFTKNRILNMSQGRFIDEELGILGYEGSHMIDIVFQLSKCSNIKKIISKETDNLNYYLKFTLENNISVNFYTSIVGKIKYNFPFIQKHKDILIDEYEQKYRVVSVEGKDQQDNTYEIIGFFEPIYKLRRLQGSIVVMKNGKTIEVKAPLLDNSMKNHFEKVISYFQDLEETPYDLTRALNVVKILAQLK